jgi:hypothetical protein
MPEIRFFIGLVWYVSKIPFETKGDFQLFLKNLSGAYKSHMFLF